jgi:flagellar export protein FliJ
MSVFRFRLAKVLEWRRTELTLAETRFRRQAATLAALDGTRAALDASAIRAEMLVRDSPRIEGADLAALDVFRRHVARRRAALAASRAQAQQELDRLQSAMLEARRRFRLLERLRDRRFAEWKEAEDRELDQLASDSHLAGLARRGSALS